jgi:DNA (cytosine-5)-methyltransferase 1
VTAEPGAQCQNYIANVSKPRVEPLIFDPLNNKADEKCTSLGTNCGMSTGRSIAFTQNQAGDVLTGDVAPSMGTNQNATGRNTPKTLTGSAVRRLTPRECERLQGFPDDYTKVPTFIVRHRKKCQTLPTLVESFIVDGGEDSDYELKEAQQRLKDARAAAMFEVVSPTDNKTALCGCKVRKVTADDCADGPRYKALGNSMCAGYDDAHPGVMRWLGKRIAAVDLIVRAGSGAAA